MSGEAHKKLEEINFFYTFSDSTVCGITILFCLLSSKFQLRRRLEGASTGKCFEDLTSTSRASLDYYTQEEMIQFKKSKKMKSLSKKEKLDLDALEAEVVSTGLGLGILDPAMM